MKQEQPSLEEIMEILERTPETLLGWLGGLSQPWYRVNEGPDTWSPFDVVGHLVHGEETDWIPRAAIILEHGEERPFEPFDRFAQFQRFKEWTLPELLDRFAQLRETSLKTLRGWNLTPAQLSLSGIHPEFGKVTLSQLLATWAVHDLNHISQIARVMAHRCRHSVGPWSKYLSILR
ncbi:MAG TPA: DinB family protein [Acidobacteriota bacterium]|nr:DinB family protein [Acidobacteriota bacterium]